MNKQTVSVEQKALPRMTEQLFSVLVLDAVNWSGTPLYEGNKMSNGCLSELKKRGLVQTFTEPNPTFPNVKSVFVSFTQRGIDLAHDLELPGHEYMEARV